MQLPERSSSSPKPEKGTMKPFQNPWLTGKCEMRRWLLLFQVTTFGEDFKHKAQRVSWAIMISHFIYCTIQVFKTGISLDTNYLSYCAVSIPALSDYMPVLKLIYTILCLHIIYIYIMFFHFLRCLPLLFKIFTVSPSFKIWGLSKSNSALLKVIRWYRSCQTQSFSS